jgi:hypothetical protein
MIEFEHTIFILLLLSVILNAKPPQPRWAILIILVGVLLVFIPPAHTLSLPWDLILGFVLPFLLWKTFAESSTQTGEVGRVLPYGG